MKKLLLLFAFAAVAFTLNAQTKDSEFFNKVQKLISKAKGAKYIGVTGEEEKVGEQVFTYDSVTVNQISLDKDNSGFFTHCSEIDWLSFKSFYDIHTKGNTNLIYFYMEFKNKCKNVYNRDPILKRESYKIIIFVLLKDLDELISIFDAQYK
jgi:hypothetical protein